MTTLRTLQKLERKDLWSLEEYAQKREDFRRQVMQHKKARTLHLGPNLTLLFEDRLTMQYQVQEMLRTERIFEAAGIQEELDAYNPLIPDGANWKATLLIEFDDVEERKKALAQLIGIEVRVWLQVAGHEPVQPIADEDLERETAEKTSSVHFLRFELTPTMVESLKAGAALDAGVDHVHYRHELKPVPDALKKSLLADLA
ncbi:MAG TPA: DUF3501 family protein [Gammaproteobacteria bacterium]|nr:DUF3501 family protein [Gammaproteobacteria bacterium]